MGNIYKNGKFVLSDKRYTPIRWRTPDAMQYDIFQDGTPSACRDAEGNLWMICGHERVGHIYMLRGTCMDDLQEAWKSKLNFSVGHADYAFNGVRYPEGIKARGSIWPLGLYICPKTNRFFAFIHNETGWSGQGLGYDALGYSDQPRFDSDFRHVGLMHSDDQGQNWTFDRWILTSEHVCFSEKFNPNGDCMIGQQGKLVRLGNGEHSIYVEGEYIYLFYEVLTVNIETGKWESCDQYVARSRRRYDGTMGDFVKYYDGSFCEPGNFGRETPIAKDTWHGRVMYSKKHGEYLLSYTRFEQEKAGKGGLFGGTLEIRTSKDMLHWSEPVQMEYNGEQLTAHYALIMPDDRVNPPYVLEDDTFSVLQIDKGTAMRYTAKFIKE